MTDPLNMFILIVTRLKPGQSISIGNHELREISSPPPFMPADWIMEHIVGSAYEFSWRSDDRQRAVVFHRHVYTGERRYISPDRRHLVAG